MMPNLNKPSNDEKAYRPISIRPRITKIFEKLLLKRMESMREERNLIHAHQFGFRQPQPQVHRTTNIS